MAKMAGNTLPVINGQCRSISWFRSSFQPAFWCMTSDTQTIILRKVSDSKDALHHFADSNGKYIDPLDDTLNYIGGYILGEVNQTITDAIVTNYEYEVNENDSKRFISLLDPDAVQPAVADLIRAMR